MLERSFVHPIEAESYRIMAERLSLDHLAAGSRAVVERIVHASADLDFGRTVVASEAAVAAGVAALVRGAPVVVDVQMVAAGITAVATECFLAEAVAGLGGVPTRSAVAVRRAAEHHRDGAIWVVGCAPTALVEIIDLAAAGGLRPALVVGMPVGFVGAADAKDRLRASGLPAISNVGDKGGSAVAAAAVNALARLGGLR